VGEFDGRRRIGHGGAIYGFATDLSALPDEKLGVVVVASKDSANAVATHIADDGLRLMLAVRQGKPLPGIEKTSPLDPRVARRLDGTYRCEDRTIDLSERGGRLWFLYNRGDYRIELRRFGNSLILDDVLFHGPKIIPDG